MVGKPEILKAMYHVQGMAEILQRLDALAKDFSFEQIREADTSELATQLQEGLKDIRQDLGEVLIGMTTMEVGELLADVQGDQDQKSTAAQKIQEEGDTAMNRQEVTEIVGEVLRAVMPEVIKAAKKQPVTSEMIDEVKKAHELFCKAVEKGEVEEVKKAHKAYSEALKAAGLAEDAMTPEKQEAEEAAKAKKAASVEEKIAALETLVNKIAGTPQAPKSNAGGDAPAGDPVEGLAVTSPEFVGKVKEVLHGSGFGRIAEDLTPRERKVEEEKREIAFVKLAAAIYSGKTTSPEVMKIARSEFLS